MKSSVSVCRLCAGGSLSQTLLSLVLAVVLTIGLTPCISWAEDAVPAQDEIVTVNDKDENQNSFTTDEIPSSSHENENVSEPIGELPRETTLEASHEVAGENNDVFQDLLEGDTLEGEKGAATPSAQSLSAPSKTAPALTAQQADLSVTCRIVGQSTSGDYEVWGAPMVFEVAPGSTAATVSETAFAAFGLSADYGQGAYGWYLNTITSPDGRVLGWDAATGKYWQLFVNGTAAQTGAGSLVLAEGDEVMWFYSAYGDTAPSSDDFVVYPGAETPDVGADWPGYARGLTGAVMVDTPTPVESATLAWVYAFKGSNAWATVSDPLIVDDDVFLVTNNELLRIDAATGEVVARSALSAKIGYMCRPLYAEGKIFVPLDGGTLEAHAADSLKCIWKTTTSANLGALKCQALSSLTMIDGKVVVGFTSPACDGSLLCCFDASTGFELWNTLKKKDETGLSEGYYWGGAAVSQNEVVIAQESGLVELISASTGQLVSSLSLGQASRASVLACPDSENTYLVVTKDDGVLHKIVRTNDELHEVASVQFATTSTSTPAVAQGKVFVCGRDAQGYGVLAVIDFATMQLESVVRGSKGAAQSTPLVSVQADGTYAYFTCNAKPGGVYMYKLGDVQAQVLYTPDTALQQFCVASVIADLKGMLYYTNDSGHLFALKGRPHYGTSPEPGDESATESVIPQTNDAQTRPARMTSGQSVVASRQPVSSRARDKSNDTAASPSSALLGQKTDSLAAGKTDVSSVSTSPIRDIKDTSSPINWLALFGIGSGVVGLVAVAIFFAGKRSRKNEQH